MEYIKLKNVCSKIGSGSTPKGGASVYIDEGTSLIRSQNVYNLNFSYKGLAHINEEAAHKLRGVTIKKNDILINITGDSVARTCIVPDDVIPARVNQHVAIIRPNNKILNPFYLSYYLASPFMQAVMLNHAVGKGASRNAMTKEMIGNYLVPQPCIFIQEKIVGILKNYDKLIENNNKRIKLLEQMAENLYKEWFVRFRFPGYEDVEFLDGFPKEWKICRTDQLSKIKAGGDAPDDATKEITDKCSIPIYSNGIENEGLYGYTSKAKINKPSITISARGTVGYTCLRRVSYTPIVRLICIIPHEEKLANWLFYYFKRTIVTANGTSQQQITIPMMSREKVLLPTNDLIQKFYEYSTCYLDEIDSLKAQNSNLEKQRDMLLPRLMSGKIEV